LAGRVAVLSDEGCRGIRQQAKGTGGNGETTQGTREREVRERGNGAGNARKKARMTDE